MALTGCNQNASDSDPACLLGMHMEGYMSGWLAEWRDAQQDGLTNKWKDRRSDR